MATPQTQQEVGHLELRLTLFEFNNSLGVSPRDLNNGYVALPPDEKLSKRSATVLGRGNGGHQNPLP